MTSIHEEINGDCGKPSCQSPYSYMPRLFTHMIRSLKERRTAHA